jgi:hypothetical protein
MNRITTSLFTACLCAVANLPAFADTPPSGSERSRARLEQHASRLDERLHGKTGAREAEELRRQRREIQDLIRRLETGESVEKREVDRAVGKIELD